MIVYAIGDIHGRDDLLERLHSRIEQDAVFRASSTRPKLIHLGDYIDGGPDSRGVIDRLMKPPAGFETICLAGNHEQMMLACLDTDDRSVWWNWISNGGEATLRSFGYNRSVRGNDPSALREALSEDRIAWLKTLPLTHTEPGYLFVHAGIVPGVPIEKQKPHDLVWIRSHFLESDVDHGLIVVHGHTQTEAPEVRPNRIGIDTGAARPKTLTAVAMDTGAAPRFFSVSEG